MPARWSAWGRFERYVVRVELIGEQIQNGAREAPVAVGGVGGSGTRVVASILTQLGFYLGGDLNDSLDNLWFTLLFKRSSALDCPAAEFEDLLRIFQHVMSGGGELSPADVQTVIAASISPRPQHGPEWLSQRADSLLRECRRPRSLVSRWAWKEPNTHVLLPRLTQFVPQLRYVHVARNGLDMAYSANQNQLHFWGAQVLDGIAAPAGPSRSLKFWVAAERSALQAAAGMKERFLLVNYDRLCANPRTGLAPLLEFFGVEASAERLEAATSLIRAPGTIGRFKQFPRENFDAQDVAFVRDCGFDTDWRN